MQNFGLVFARICFIIYCQITAGLLHIIATSLVFYGPDLMLHKFLCICCCKLLTFADLMKLFAADFVLDFVPEGKPLRGDPKEPLRVDILFQHIQNMFHRICN